MSRQRRLWIVLAIALAATALAIVFSAKASRKMPDFEVYWRAGVRARAAEPLYRVEDQHYVLKYLPAFAVFAIPAGLLPLRAAKAAWFGVSCILLVVLLAVSVKILPERRRPPWLLVTITFVAMAKFYGHELVLGQVNLLLAVLGVAAVASMRAGREAVAGVLIAIAIVIKPYAAIFLPWLLARRRSASMASAAIALGVVLLLPVPLYGFGGNLALLAEWWDTVSRSTAPNLLSPDNVSVAAMFAKWIGQGETASALAGAAGLGLLLIAAAVVLRRGHVPFPETLEAALLLTLMPLISPQGWDYVFLASTPAILLLANYEDLLPLPIRVATAAAVAAIAFSIYDVMGRAGYAAFMALSAISVCYLVVVCALASARWRGIA